MSTIAAHLNIQAFTSQSYKRLTKDSLSGRGPDVVPCEEVIVLSDPDDKCQSDDEVTYDLRNAAREPNSHLDKEVPNEAWFSPMEPQTIPSKAWCSPTQRNNVCESGHLVEGYASVISQGTGSHPFALEDDSPKVSSPVNASTCLHAS